MRGVIVLVVLAVAYAACWGKPRALRQLGLVMVAAAVVLTPTLYYLIEVGGFPADLTLSCGLWIAVGLVGLITYTANRK